MKKLLTILFGMLFIGTSLATYQANDGRLSPEYKEMNFQATLENNSVAMTWAPFSLPAGHSFVYWKVMQSQKTESPVYKEANSEYITYNSNLDFTWYTNNSPRKGATRYRICAITKANDGYHRYCSKEVKKISIETTEQTENKEVYKKDMTIISDTQKAVIDQLAVDFLKKLDEKYSNDKAKKNMVIGNIVSQLNVLSKRQAKMKGIITYLVEKLEATIDPMEEIKNILKIE